MNKLFRAHLLFHILRLLPRKFPVKYAELQQPFFVLGSGRNGSTMLNRMLNQHSKFHLPSEQYFLGPSIFKFHYYNFALWRDLVKVIGAELIPSGGSHTWQVDDLPDFLKWYLLPKEKKTLQYLLDQIYRHGSGEKAIWGDTTPLNTYYLEEIYHTFPHAKYLFLVRDGRDVVSSYKKGGVDVLGELSLPQKGAEHWMHSLKKYRWLSQKTSVYLVRYEELVADTESCLKGICDFLNVEFEADMLRFNEQIPDTDMYKLPVHQNLHKPVFGSSVGNFQSGLTSEEMDQILPIIQKGLKDFEYL